MTTFLNYGPGTGVDDLSKIGRPSLWWDGVCPAFLAVQCNRYVEVETSGGCLSASNGDFVRDTGHGLQIVRREDWTYTPFEQNPPVPEVRVANQIRDLPPPAAPAAVPVEQFPAQMGNKSPIEIPPRWRLERQNLEPIRVLCDKAGLSHLGRRPDLINRLREYAEKTAAR